MDSVSVHLATQEDLVRSDGGVGSTTSCSLSFDLLWNPEDEAFRILLAASESESGAVWIRFSPYSGDAVFCGCLLMAEFSPHSSDGVGNVVRARFVSDGGLREE